MKHRRVVAINRYFFPDDSATSQMLTDVATNLVAGGHEVCVLTSRRQLEGGRALLPRHDRYRGVEVRRVWSTNIGRGSLVGRAVDYLTFYAALAWELVGRIRRGDIVIAMTDPPMLGTVVGFVSGLKGAHAVNWHQDIYPEVAASLGVLSPGSWVHKRLLGLRNWSLRNAVANVVLGEKMADHVRAQEAGAPQVTLIPNWFEDVPPPQPRSAENSYRRELGLGSELVVGYAGNFGRAHALDGLLEAAVGLQDREDIHFLMVGNGPRYEPLKQRVAELGLRRWHFLPYQPRDRAPEFLAAIDLHLICLDPRVEGLIVPSKLYGIMAAGRPTLFFGAPDSDVARVLHKHECGLSAASIESLRAAIVRLADDPVLRNTLGRNARTALDTNYSRTVALEHWNRLVANVAASG